MDFDFTTDQLAIKETAERFSTERIAPGYMERDSSHLIDRDLLREMGELGLVGADIPEKFGGLGLDCVTGGLIIEQVSYADFNIATPLLMGALVAQPLAKYGQAGIADEWIPKMCRGEAVFAIALTEPRGGSDAGAMQLNIRRDGDHYVVNGEKTSISFADQADAVLLFGRTSDDGARGITALFVPFNLPNIERTRFDDLGQTCVGRGSIFFDDTKVEENNRVGEEGLGFIGVMQGFDYSRALIGLQVLAAAQASVDETWKYVTEREAFGRPIVKFEGVSAPLAEAETMLNAARLLCYKTLWLRDQERPHTAEAAMCKWWCPKVAFEIIHKCLLLHGHLGYSRDFPHQQRLRDVLGYQLGDGTEQIQKLVVAREKVGKVAIPYV